MKQFLILSIFVFTSISLISQSFTRSELPTSLGTPWEITYGPHGYLWVTENQGRVSRIDPSTGDKTVVYTAPDYFGGSPLENSPHCPNLKIGVGTLGLALHPSFADEANSFIYFLYSYNSGTEDAPATKFRLKQLTWNSVTNEVVNDANIVNEISTGYDHFGGRLMAVTQDGIPYLFLTIGDNGRSEISGPDCYVPQSENPNNFAQDVTTQNGKIHRFNMDGTIPDDNPIPGNSFYTRGLRNPQGLMYNPSLEIIYDIEHGDDTDDEINVLIKGMNYGWKNVRGYHDDNSYEGEADYVANYVPNPLVENDALIEPLYSWCNVQATSTMGTDWCTVAPSGGIYYGSEAIPQWTNSLLVVTLKDGVSTDKEVYQFKLEDNGDLVPSTIENPNPRRFFGADQDLNGRLRDIAVSNDGETIYLINNGGAPTSKITVYKYDGGVNTVDPQGLNIGLFPNPASDELMIKGAENIKNLVAIQITSLLGESSFVNLNGDNSIDISHLNSGVHFIQIAFGNEVRTLKFLKI
jgi:glucose/arabinose dehydrogenase